MDILLIGKNEVSYLLCLFDTIRSKYLFSTIRRAIDKKSKNIDGDVVLTDERRILSGLLITCPHSKPDGQEGER